MMRLGAGVVLPDAIVDEQFAVEVRRCRALVKLKIIASAMVAGAVNCTGDSCLSWFWTDAVFGRRIF